MMMMMVMVMTTTNCRKINQKLKTRRIPSEHILLLRSSRIHKKSKNTLTCYKAVTQLYCCCFILCWCTKKVSSITRNPFLGIRMSINYLFNYEHQTEVHMIFEVIIAMNIRTVAFGITVLCNATT
jgi:hypothetical protein